jgi:nucleotide-binding universal stress UspA family protein
MFTHVLIPLDGSPLAERALDYVPHMVRPQGKVTLVVAVEKLANLQNDELQAATSDPNDSVFQPQRYLEHIATRLKLNGVEAQSELREGQPADVIAQLAVALGVDAIIMTSHGHFGLERLLFGSVTDSVLSAAPCPVLVIPDRERQRVPAEDRTVTDEADTQLGFTQAAT